MNSILITGASSGIGKAVAEIFLKEGWRVGLMARRAEKLEVMAEKHKRAVALPGDVSSENDVERVFRTFTDEIGKIDVLFNNAGVFVPPAPIDKTPLNDWQTAVDVNLTGMFLCARAEHGRISNHC